MTRRAGGALAIAAALLSLAGCASLPSVLRSDVEPRIWDVHAARYVDAATLEQRLIDTRLRLLGEVHDNPTHHALRAGLLRSIERAGKRPAIVFEQFDLSHEAALQEAQRAPIDAEALARAGALDRRSWDWPLHEPLLEAALAARMPVHAGNASRGALDTLVKTGRLDGIDVQWRARLDAAPWDETRAGVLAHEIEEGHCGKLPQTLVPRLALAQRVRDAALAAALLTDANADGAILIAGNGHVRADVGVPLYLGDAARESISVGFVEVDADDARERDLGHSMATAHPGFDYLWLTDAVHRPDPCAMIPAPRQEATPPAASTNDRK